MTDPETNSLGLDLVPCENYALQRCVEIAEKLPGDRMKNYYQVKAEFYKRGGLCE